MSIDKKRLVKLVSFMATFDGGLYKQSSKGNAAFIMNMREANLDYVLWVKDTLENVTNAKVGRRIIKDDGYNRSPQVRLESRTHPFFTAIHDRLYIMGHKVIDPHMLTLLDAEGLAIIFMADGSGERKHGVRLHTKGFSYHDNMALSRQIHQVFGIRSTVTRAGKYWEIRIKSADIGLMVSCVGPYIAPSFRYKLDCVTPHSSIEGDDIVWPAWEHAEVLRNQEPLALPSNNARESNH